MNPQKCINCNTQYNNPSYKLCKDCYNLLISTKIDNENPGKSINEHINKMIKYQIFKVEEEMKIDIAKYLREHNSSFINGFLDAVYSVLPNSPLFYRQDYFEGYAEGSQYKDEINGTSPFCSIRKLKEKKC